MLNKNNHTKGFTKRGVRKDLIEVGFNAVSGNFKFLAIKMGNIAKADTTGNRPLFRAHIKQNGGER